VFAGSSASNWRLNITGANVSPSFSKLLSAIETEHPARAFGNYLGGTIQWTQLGTSGNRTFALQPGSGPGYRDAAPLTTVKVGGTNTRTIQLADASWFYDGANPATWNLSYFGEQGDYVAIGDSRDTANIAQIATIDRTGFESITFVNEISCTAGQGVWFAGNSNARNAMVTWRNRGAGQ
jgi:hypothetical protein